MSINNMKLLSQHTLNGHGGMGEGMSLQLARDGRRVLWLAHESAPKNFTAVDVTDPRKPRVIVQTDLPIAPCAPTRSKYRATSWRWLIKSPWRARSPPVS